MAGRHRAARPRRQSDSRHSPSRTRSPTRASSWPPSTCRCTASPTRRTRSTRRPNERTFNVDLVNNTTGAADSADGKIDPSGQHWYQPGERADVSRDNLRQGEADLIVFTKSVAHARHHRGRRRRTSTRRASTTSASRWAASSAASHLHFASDTQTAALSVPGGVITQLRSTRRHSAPRIIARHRCAELNARSHDIQHDSSTTTSATSRRCSTRAIPSTTSSTRRQLVPLHLQKVIGDTVVPNSATDRLIDGGQAEEDQHARPDGGRRRARAATRP